MRQLATILAGAALSVSAAQAGSLFRPPSPYATVERQAGSTRVIEHDATAGPVVRRVRRARVVVKRRRARAETPEVAGGVSRVVALSEKQEFYPNASIAGGCRDGGTIRRRDALGNVVLRQREVCEGLAPLAGRRWSVAARSP